MNKLKMKRIEQYNDEPVCYCKDCLSLRIKQVATGLNLEYCDKCGSTSLAEAHIYEWEDLYKARYGFNYLNEELKSNK